MRAKENLLKVATRFSEAVTMEGGRGEPVGRLEVIGSDTPAMVGVCAVDGKDLAESRRMVLLYTTETANTGMVVTPDRTKMFNYGTLPVLMKVGRLDATLQNAHGKNMALYALGLNGARRQRLPLAWEKMVGSRSISTPRVWSTAQLRSSSSPWTEPGRVVKMVGRRPSTLTIGPSRVFQGNLSKAPLQLFNNWAAM